MSNICKTVTLRTRKINRGDLSIPAKRGGGVSQRGKKKPGLSRIWESPGAVITVSRGVWS